MKQERFLFSAEEIPAVSQKIRAKMSNCSIFTFEGPLGAGKTTLIGEILYQSGVKEPITSPTFTYLNMYENAQGQKFYHFDLYRLNSLEEFLAAGFDEYLYAPHSWTFIEWPAIIMPLLKEKVCFCELDYHNNERELRIRSEL